MKRNTTGKFLTNWAGEPKKRINLSLTETAWTILDDFARVEGLSRSELIEHYARSLRMQPPPSSADPKTGDFLNNFENHFHQQEEQDYDRLDQQFLDRVDRGVEDNCNVSECDQAEAEIQRLARQVQEQANTLSAILSASTDHIYVFDRVGRYQYVSQGGATVLGLQPSDVIGKTWRELGLPAEIMESIDRQRSQAMATGQSLSNEVTFPTPQGVRYYEYVVTPLQDTAYSTGAVVVISRDITERKQSEEGLRRYQLLSEHTRDIVLYLQRDGKIIEANQAAVNAYGYTRTELLSLAIADLRAPETYRSLNQQLNQAKQEGILFETVHRRKDGRCFPVEVSAQSTLVGTETMILSVIRDISERKQVEAEREYLLQCEQSARLAAEAAEQRAQFLAEAGTVLNSSLDYQLTLNSVANLVVPTLADWCAIDILNAEGSLERVATAHVDPAKVEWGLELHRRYPPDLNAPRGLAQVLRSGQPEYYPEVTDEQIVAGARDAEHLQILRALELKSIMIVPLIARGKTLGAISFVATESGHSYNPTDLSLAEELARRAALALDNAHLYQEAQQAQRQAEAANRMKDEFLAVLSHELRTLMNPILGWAKLLQKGMLNADRTAMALTTIERNAQLQVQLIEDLLDIARILQGKFSLNSHPVNLVSTIEAAIDTVRLAAESKNIQIQTHFGATIASVLGDAARLQQVIWNLLSNAVKFTPTGGQVEIRLTRIGSQAQIQVKDTGKGIDPEFLPYVFDTFRQADSSTTRTHGGLGLGLAIVRHIVELHGGSVKAESLGEGQGATFTILLPLLSTSSSKETEAISQHLPSLAGIRVLVVDDEADTLDLIQFTLEAAGAIVIPAISGTVALQLFEQTQPDILVSDIGMPEMDGYTLVNQIREHFLEGQRIPAIALTAYAGVVNQQQALAAGFQRHLAKPIEPEQLVKAIAQIMNLI